MHTTTKAKHQAGLRYRKIVSVLGSLVPGGLTEKEVEMLDYLWQSGGVLTTDSRKHLCEQMEITSDYLNNYVKKLRKKGVIVKDELHEFLKLKLQPDDQPHVLSIIFETNKP